MMPSVHYYNSGVTEPMPPCLELEEFLARIFHKQDPYNCGEWWDDINMIQQTRYLFRAREYIRNLKE